MILAWFVLITVLIVEVVGIAVVIRDWRKARLRKRRFDEMMKAFFSDEIYEVPKGRRMIE